MNQATNSPPTMLSQTNYYDLLGIQKEASINDIRKAYYNLAFQYHPDKNHDNKEASTENFHQISHAYKVLSNIDQRNLYNLLGTDDYILYKNQNSTFQNFFETAYKIKKSCEQNEQKNLNNSKFLSGHYQHHKDFQKAFQELFEEDSSSEEEDEQPKSNNIFSYFNHYSKNCNFNQNKPFGDFYPRKQTAFKEKNFLFQKNEKYSNCFPDFYQEKTNLKKKPSHSEKNQKILERLNNKKPIFLILHNQIRKKKKV